MEGLHSGVQQVADLGLSNCSPLGAAWCGYSTCFIIDRQQRECKQTDRRCHKTFRIRGISWPSHWSRVFPEKLSYSTSREIPGILLNQMNHHGIYKSSSPAPALSQINPHTNSQPISLRYTVIVSSILRLVLPSSLIPLYFSNKTQYAPLVFPIGSTCPAHLVISFDHRTVFDTRVPIMNPLVGSVLSQINPVHNSPVYLLKIHFNIIHNQLRIALPSNLRCFLLCMHFSSIRATFAAHLITLVSIARKTSDKQSKAQTFSFCSFLQYLVTSYFSVFLDSERVNSKLWSCFLPMA